MSADPALALLALSTDSPGPGAAHLPTDARLIGKFQAHVEKKQYDEAVAVLRDHAVHTRLYERQDELFREKNDFGSTRSIDELQAKYNIHLAREAKYLAEKQSYEQTVSLCSYSIEPQSSVHAIRVLDLIKYVGYYMPGIEQYVNVENILYSDAQKRIITICSKMLKDKTLPIELRNPLEEEIFQATFNSIRGSSDDGRIVMSQALKQYTGIPVEFTEVAPGHEEEGLNDLAKIYCKIIMEIKKIRNVPCKEDSEREMISSIAPLVKKITSSNKAAEREAHQHSLLNLLQKYVFPELSSADGFNMKDYGFKHQEVGYFLTVDLVVFLTRVLKSMTAAHANKKALAVSGVSGSPSGETTGIPFTPARSMASSLEPAQQGPGPGPGLAPPAPTANGVVVATLSEDSSDTISDERDAKRLKRSK